MNSRKPFVRFRMRYTNQEANDLRRSGQARAKVIFAIAPFTSETLLRAWMEPSGMDWWPVNGRESEVGR